MKAAILTKLKEPLIIDDVDLPGPAHGQVLVKILYSGVCGSQLGEIEGVKGKDDYLPHLLGHEGSGIVEEVGSGVTRVKKNDAVVLHWRKGEGLESKPPKYGWRGKVLNAGWVTTFNEYALVSENRLTAIPSDFDMAAAALLGCAVTTGLGIINNDAKVKKGESVVIFGAGGVGLCAIQGAVLAGASPIVAIDLFDHKLALAEKFGATHLINSKDGKARQAVLAAVGAAGADVVIDNTGNVGVIELSYELTQPRGRTILVGVPPAGAKVSIDTMPLHFGKILTGSHGGGSNPSEDIPRCVKLAQAGRLKLDGMITDRFPLKDINQALDALRSGKAAGRVLIEVGR